MKRSLLFIFLSLASVLIVIAGTAILSFRSAKDCDVFVIDTYEVASGVDIPKLVDYDCHYLEEEALRIGIYTIDTTITKLDNYIPKFSFSPVSEDREFLLWTADYLQRNEVEQPIVSMDLYTTSGVNETNRWQCFLDKNTGKLWFEIQWLKSISEN